MTSSAVYPPSSGRLLPAAGVYLGGLVIGLTLVSFPASSGVLKAAHGFSDAEYGAIYLPQLVAAIGGALAGGAAAGRLRLKTLWLVSLVCFAVAQVLLAASAGASKDHALLMIMAATAFFGFGFGFGGGPLNGFAVLLFPTRSGTALTALHMCAGAGLALGPALFAALAERGLWLFAPGSLFALTVIVAAVSLAAVFPEPDAAEGLGAGPADEPGRSSFFWICALIAVVYSLAEGTFSNWAIIYLQEERGLAGASAAMALTAFWAALAIGRLLASLLAVRFPPPTFLVVQPLLMIAAFLLLPRIAGPHAALAGFAFAGLACSAFFPMLVAFTAGPFPARVSWIASMLTAAMMVGVGLGSYAVGALKGAHSIGTLYYASVAYPVLALALVLLARARQFA